MLPKYNFQMCFQKKVKEDGWVKDQYREKEGKVGERYVAKARIMQQKNTKGN